MKKYFLIIGIISLFLIAACSQQVVETDDHEHGVDDVHKDEAEQEDEMIGTSMEVPASGNEAVEEMIVVEGEMESEVVEVNMIAKQWAFDPDVIKVKQGDKVKLNIESIDVNHGIALPDFGVSVRFGPGETATAEFTADKKGDFTFFCNVPCGRDHGKMRGTLVVE
ncbi:cupredoxin domain-containing protein [Candidatus Woesearchaeota archaeon]|nr:cupredoxin domain-containing protein [Candidatus Woesearchaeota archaeon]